MNDTWNDLIELNTDADIKAREHLCDELREVGVTDAVIIWPDEGRAYLDSGRDEDYTRTAQHFGIVYDGEDKSPVNDALLRRYNELFEQEREKLQTAE